MAMQMILSSLRRAVDKYDMIQPHDKIAVGLSGGKDSLVLLAALKAFQKFSDYDFELVAVTIDLGFANTDFTALKEFTAALDVAHHIVASDIYEIVFNIRKEANPCSLCAKLRRGILNSTIKSLGYTKLALGHHADDLIETFLLSMIYEGRLSTFQPVSYMDRMGITMIRPLILTNEADIIREARAYPILNNPCPANHYTQREYMKNLIKTLNQHTHHARDRILSAITCPERQNLIK